MTDTTIRVGVVGAGANTRSMHIPKLKAIAGVEIVSVANRSRASSEQVAQEFGIPQVYDHWWELIAAPGRRTSAGASAGPQTLRCVIPNWVGTCQASRGVGHSASVAS